MGLNKAQVLDVYSAGVPKNSEAVFFVSCEFYMNDVDSLLLGSEIFDTCFSHFQKFMWKFQQYEDEDL